MASRVVYLMLPVSCLTSSFPTLKFQPCCCNQLQGSITWWHLPQLHMCLLLNSETVLWHPGGDSFNFLDACANLDPLGMGGGAQIFSLSIPWPSDSQAPSTWLLGVTPCGGDLLPTVDICSAPLGWLALLYLTLSSPPLLFLGLSCLK